MWFFNKCGGCCRFKLSNSGLVRVSSPFWQHERRTGAHQWDGTAARWRSLRSGAGSELGAAPPEKEAEFPAVCSGGRGLLTPRNPEKNAAGSGGLTVCSICSGRFLPYRWLCFFFFFKQTEGVGQKTEQRSGTRRGWATSYRHGQGLRLPLQAAHHRWQR